MNNWLNLIDKVIYINLDHRIDRNIEIVNEFKRLNIPSNKYIRLSATKNDKNGAIGCSFSHIRALQMAIDKNYEYVLIFEDDFSFIDDDNYVHTAMNYLFNEFKKNNDWSIVCLGRGARQEIKHINDKYLSKAIAVGTASGYIIHKSFYEILMNNFKTGLNNLMKGYDVYNNTLDGKWIELQKDNKWYIFSPSLGYQRSSYSDIERSMVEYLRFDKTIKFNEKQYISCNLMGGLGNQMFQIAAIHSIGLNNNLEPIFEKIYESPPLSFPRPVYWNSVFKKINVVNNDKYNKIQFINYNIQNNNYIPFKLAHNKSYRLTGYFQNPNFFREYHDNILDLFKLDNKYNTIINNIYNDINKNNLVTVSIHVRRTDYIKLQHIHYLQNMEYYINAINYIENNDKRDKLYLIFSDDLNWCKNEFNKLKINCIYIDKNEKEISKDVLDMYLMSKCNHNIITNSTFSWWSSYMNINNDKIICAPKQWFIDENMNKEAMYLILDNMRLF